MKSNHKLTYMHAIANPFDNSIRHPFEPREVEVEIEGRIEDGECHYSAKLNGRKFPTGYSTDAQKALDSAIHEAQYALMDESREPWK